jgi:hypothetical protein
MSSSPLNEASDASAFVCDCEVWMRPACGRLPRHDEHDGKQYCVLHYPGKKKSADFDRALNNKLKDKNYDFGGVWFHDRAVFRCTFTGDANFNSATFNEEADFDHATFEAGASFRAAVFRAGAHFKRAVFKSTYFGSATFEGPADFSHAAFYGPADFSFATFNGRLRFAGRSLTGDSANKVFEEGASLNLWSATVENPDRLSFRKVRLRPHWFVNVDARKFEFIDVAWDWRHIKLREEINSTGKTDITSAHRLLATACRNLAVNAEENHRYEEASRFRYMAMDARRLERSRGWAIWTLDWWYWFASGYGERILRALAVFLAIWFGFALIYSSPRLRCATGDARPSCIGWDTTPKTQGFFDGFVNSAVYAVETMTLQKPEPRPFTPLAHIVVLLCTIVGPVQAALLALAIRRKFMR